MLATEKLKAFVPTTQPEKAKMFYKEILGLDLLTEDEYALEFDSNGTLLRVTIVRDLKPHPFTILGWNVKNIVGVIRELNEKGVFCERYDFFQQDDLGIWQSPSGAKVAWFRDPDGNLLSLTE